MAKQTSARISSLAARYMRLDRAKLLIVAASTEDEQQTFCSDIRRVAASVVSQDEVPQLLSDVDA